MRAVGEHPEPDSHHEVLPDHAGPSAHGRPARPTSTVLVAHLLGPEDSETPALPTMLKNQPMVARKCSHSPLYRNLILKRVCWAKNESTLAANRHVAANQSY